MVIFSRSEETGYNIDIEIASIEDIEFVLSRMIQYPIRFRKNSDGTEDVGNGFAWKSVSAFVVLHHQYILLDLSFVRFFKIIHPPPSQVNSPGGSAKSFSFLSWPSSHVQSFSVCPFCSALLPVALPLDEDLMGIVGKPIEEGVGEKGIIEEPHPFLQGPCARDDGGGPLVPLDHYLIEILGLGCRQSLKSEVVDDEDVRMDKLDELFTEGVIRSRLMKPFEEYLRSHHQHVEAPPHGTVA